MTKENKVLMAEAREGLKGKWGIVVGAYFLATLVSIIAGFPKNVGPLLRFIIAGPIELGVAMFSLSFIRGEEVKLEQIWQGFNDFLRALAAYAWMTLFVILWALLFIIPGIIAALAYSQTFFLLADEKDISPRDAIKKSKSMMNGYKGKLFLLALRFFGWFLLSILTLGIGFLWFIPYYKITLAKFYEDIKNQPQTA